MKTVFLSITPMMPSMAPLDEALAFYIEHMGFEVLWHSDGGAGIARDGVSLNVVENMTQAWAENASFSIGVRRLDELYERFRGIPANVGPLERKPWGRLEFHVIVPFGICFQFYEQTES